jgi:hypothetical protein
LDDCPDNLIESWLSALVKENLVQVYRVEGKDFIQVVTWNKHQQIRAKRSKYPAPGTMPLFTEPAINGNHMLADDSICARNPIQSNPNPIRESNPAQPLKENKKSDEEEQTADLAPVIKAFEDCGGTIATPMIAQELTDAEKEYGADIVIAAFRKAAGNGKRGVSLLNYCRPIFEQYKADGIPKIRSPGKGPPGKKVEGVIIKE